LVCCNEKNLATLVFPTILEQADQSMDWWIIDHLDLWRVRRIVSSQAW
jgi:hypothetical protein